MVKTVAGSFDNFSEAAAAADELRKAGFLESLEGAGITVNILTDQEAYLVDKATTVATDILTANPDVDISSFGSAMAQHFVPWAQSHDKFT